MVTVIDVPDAQDHRRTSRPAWSRRAWPSARTGKTIVNTSETTNMAHFFDFETRKMVASVLVGARPRIAQFKHDGSEVWVSSELGGTVSVIDAQNTS